MMKPALALCAAAALLAQPRPHFEVASIKPSPAELNFGPYCDGGGSPGTMVLRCSTAQELIEFAYGYYANGRSRDLRPLHILGGPSWIDSNRFDIEAKAEGSPGDEMMAGPMLQTLLEERFKLKVHRESREAPVYALILAKSGLKLQPLKEACGADSSNPCGVGKMRSNGQEMTIDQHAASMADFSATLPLDRTVIDRTGVSGLFDFHLEFVLDDSTSGTPFGHVGPASEGAAGESIFTAIQKLGLGLEPAKSQVEFLVIDHVEKPAAN